MVPFAQGLCCYHIVNIVLNIKERLGGVSRSKHAKTIIEVPVAGLNSLPSIDEPHEASAACEKQRWWQKLMFIDFASNCVHPTFFFRFFE